VTHRRQYLEAVAGVILATSAGCLGDADQTGASETTTAARTTKQATKGTTKRTTRETTTEGVQNSEEGQNSADETDSSSIGNLPTVSFTFEYTKDDGVGQVSITHRGGDSIDANRLTVTIDGTTAFEAGTVAATYREESNEWKETAEPDDTLRISGGKGTSITNGQTITIEWMPDESDPVLIARSDVMF